MFRELRQPIFHVANWSVMNIYNFKKNQSILAEIMSQVPAIAQTPGATGRFRPPPSTALVPLERLDADNRPGFRPDSLEVRRFGNEARRGYRQDLEPGFGDGPRRQGVVLEPAGSSLLSPSQAAGDSRFAVQSYFQAQDLQGEGRSQAGQILAKGHEAYRRAGAEPSEQPAPAQVVSLKV